jgi:hypothetical protein
MIAAGLVGMLLGGLIGVAASAAVDNWHDRHGPSFERGPARFDDGPRR